MSPDEFLIKTAEHLMQQTEQSRLDTGPGAPCAFAGTSGNSCALGCHMPRELAVKLDALPSNSWKLISTYALTSEILRVREPALEAVRLFEGLDNTLLQRAQDVHDIYPDREENTKLTMLYELRSIALANDADEAARVLDEMIDQRESGAQP